MKSKLTALFLFFFCCAMANAQDNNYGVKGFEPKTFDITDSLPATWNGLQAGYEIKDESEKSVGKKGDFSRYKIRFYITNTSSEAKIMYRNLSFGGHIGPITNNIALFKCLNATGARFTNKMAMMELQPCKLEADVEDKDCNSGKVTVNKRLVDIGFWIRPGETVSKTYPMITPLGEKPKVTVTYYAEVANQTGTFMTSSAPVAPVQAFARIKNLSNNTYLNIQPGTLVSSNIDNEWWSADWEILPVPNSNYYNIRNRWKSNFISTENSSLMSDNGAFNSSQWIMEPVAGTNSYTFKNLATGYKLVVQNNTIGMANVFGSPANAQWIVEQ
jgi:hypothetical protein